METRGNTNSCCDTQITPEVTKAVRNETFDDLRCHFTEKEYFYETVNGNSRLTILLQQHKPVSDDLREELEQLIHLRYFTTANMYYKCSSIPIILKLNSLTCFTGIREKYNEPSSKYISLDSRLSPKKGEKHIGLLSFIRAVAEIGAKDNIGHLRSKAKTITDVIESDDKTRSYPGARARVLPCPQSHMTCAKVWNTNDKQLQSLKSRCSSEETTASEDEFTKRKITPLCLFARKLVRPMRDLPNILPHGMFVLPAQFDKTSPVYIEGVRRGLKPFSYSLDQLQNLGEGNKKLIQCAIKPHYKAMWKKDRNEFKSGELVIGTYEFIGFYFESGDKMSLRIDIIDELIIPNDCKIIESDLSEGAVTFHPAAYIDIAVYSDDDDSPGKHDDQEECEYSLSKRVKQEHNCTY